jgi:hypothetical protein
MLTLFIAVINCHCPLPAARNFPAAGNQFRLNENSKKLATCCPVAHGPGPSRAKGGLECCLDFQTLSRNALSAPRQALGHNSKAVHRAYAKRALINIPSLEDCERKATGAAIEKAS